MNLSIRRGGHIRALAVFFLFPLSALAQSAGRYGAYEIYDRDLPPLSEYAERRAAVLARLDSSSAMLVRSAEEQTRSNDVEYEFHQRSNMLYLTGDPEQQSALLLVPRGLSIDGKKAATVLFVGERDPIMETFNGKMMGPQVASQVTGIATVLPWSRLRGVLDTLLPKLSTIYYDGWLHGLDQEPLTGTLLAWDREMMKNLAAKFPQLQVKAAGLILNEMRLVKSPVELALLRKAIDISVEGHRATLRQAAPGMHEYELEAIMEYSFRRLGAEDPGYPSIVGSGPNSCILHYSTNRRQTQPGEVVLMDCGAEYHGYSADVTRTFPIGGTFTPEQREIYTLVYEAQTAGIAACRAGNDFRAPGKSATEIIAAGLVRLGIIKEPREVRRYFMHGTSHYIGLDVHDVGAFGLLKPNEVLTVEPGIYIPAGSPCDPKWWNIGVRIEDDILVTDDAPVNLSGALARSADEVEAAMKHESAR
jgi:Xaa-Pro aminopeptidase